MYTSTRSLPKISKAVDCIQAIQQRRQNDKVQRSLSKAQRFRVQVYRLLSMFCCNLSTWVAEVGTLAIYSWASMGCVRGSLKKQKHIFTFLRKITLCVWTWSPSLEGRSATCPLGKSLVSFVQRTWTSSPIPYLVSPVAGRREEGLCVCKGESQGRSS